jgi:hypothetical protein
MDNIGILNLNLVSTVIKSARDSGKTDEQIKDAVLVLERNGKISNFEANYILNNLVAKFESKMV